MQNFMSKCANIYVQMCKFYVQMELEWTVLLYRIRFVSSGHVWSKMIRYQLNFLESLCDSLFQLCHVCACLGEGRGVMPNVAC